MQVLKAIIVDDEPLARRGLALRLQNLPQVDIVTQCADGKEALTAITEHSPDLVFLDIQMPGMSGFDLICELQADTMPLIIFVTAFDQYAIDAFKVHAVDYVLKPIDDNRLLEAVERAILRYNQQDAANDKQQIMAMMSAKKGSVATMQASTDQQTWPERITIKDGNEIKLVRAADIRWIDAAGDYMCIHTGEQTHIMRTTMKQLEAMLDPSLFIRIHRSSIVNSNFIRGAQTYSNGEYQLALEEDTKLKVSRSYSQKIKAFLGE